MDENEIMELELYLDTDTAEKAFDQLLEKADALEKIFQDIGAEIGKVFKTLQKSMEGAKTSVDALSHALRQTTRALQEMSENLSLEGFADVGDQVLTLLDGAIGIAGILTDLKVANMLPDIGSMLDGIGAAIAKAGPKIAIAAAIIAAVIAAIALIIQNWDKISAAFQTFFGEVLPQAWEQFTQWLGNMVAGVAGFFTDIWNQLAPLGEELLNWLQQVIIQPVVDQWNKMAQWIAELFGSIWNTVKDVFHNIGVIITGCYEVIKAAWEAVMAVLSGAWAWIQTVIIEPLGALLSGVWDSFVSGAKTAWETVKGVFSQVAGFFKNVFEKAWKGIVSVFSVAGEIFTNIQNGILNAFKKIVNALIAGINTVVRIPFDGINAALGKIRNIQIFDLMPFVGLKTISVPQIPYLAKGAVLPANKPFLAMVGDQKHGTNIEAPLATIQEAVALVMGDQLTALQAGFNATVAELQLLRTQVGQIRVGDSVIGQAAQRYNDRLALMRGSVY